MIPLLAFALAGRSLAESVKAFRRDQRGIRVTAGTVMIALAVAVVPLYNVPGYLLTIIPDYMKNLQATTVSLNQTVGFGSAKTEAGKSDGSRTACAAEVSHVVSCGMALAFVGVVKWFNTADDKPITLKNLRGKVVLVDFWTYSCINCQRSTPHPNAGYKSYAKDGFVIVGVHAPGYTSEHDRANVLASAKQQGITYPIALDNEIDTWTAYGNQYLPAEYLIDAKGQVQHVSFGERNYSSSETLIRTAVKDATPSVTLPHATDVTDVPDVPKVPNSTLTKTLAPEACLGTEPGAHPKLQQPFGLPDRNGTVLASVRRSCSERRRIQR